MLGRNKVFRLATNHNNKHACKMATNELNLTMVLLLAFNKRDKRRLDRCLYLNNTHNSFNNHHNRNPIHSNKLSSKFINSNEQPNP